MPVYRQNVKKKRGCQRIGMGSVAQIIFKDEVVFCQLGDMFGLFFPSSLLPSILYPKVKFSHQNPKIVGLPRFK
jgi:hypothetical protein